MLPQRLIQFLLQEPAGAVFLLETNLCLLAIFLGVGERVDNWVEEATIWGTP